MSFYLYQRQAGEGCDYTIGCGTRFDKLNATTMEEAVKEVIDLDESFKDEWEDWSIEDLENFFKELPYDCGFRHIIGDRSLKNCTIFEVKDSFNMLPVLKEKYKELLDYKKRLIDRSKENKEKQLYEQLKRKFEK